MNELGPLLQRGLIVNERDVGNAFRAIFKSRLDHKRITQHLWDTGLPATWQWNKVWDAYFMKTQQFLAQTFITSEHKSGCTGSSKRNCKQFEKSSNIFIESPVSSELLCQIKYDIRLIFCEAFGDSLNIYSAKDCYRMTQWAQRLNNMIFSNRLFRSTIKFRIITGYLHIIN